VRLLYRCLRFYREYPILADRPELGWAHYRVLIDVADKAQRAALETEARTQRWSCVKLESRVRALNAIDVTPPKADGAAATTARLLAPRRGTPGICRVIEAAGAPVVDLGFACYRDVPAATRLQAGAFVRLDADGEIAAAADATRADLFTYRAAVLKVVDGDTLWVRVDLEPGRWVKQKLRLRDLDCPEIGTPAGRAAKRFTEALVAQARGVTISTTKPDKYDRYLADFFLGATERGGVGEGSGDVYLNNELLAAGRAVVKRAWEFGDWGA
jgi:micrococcal nuclease